MKITKMNVQGQLDSDGAAQFAKRIGDAYVIASCSAFVAAVAAVIAAIRWW
ncbi:hypothetical protein N8I74_15745 [Chitiniphilus purpureus]|uniref:Uncharacterized protein n=1 Tax=Chitiniphilus purpureus TaxID=2981137 RepID=A0ABY6DMN8_9NEIS|nr:hypothetical protein [Chitiniphilus sp. CD1]UXY14756.1 hypothetical protein N8I74_15745 [Chitiniphilus sp. CD1]